MNLRGLAVLLALVLVSARAETPGEAFEQGRSLGAIGAPALGRAIGSGATAPEVPQYSTAQPQSGLFAGGSGSLIAPGAAQVDGCQTNAADPDPRRRQQCEATNFLAKKSNAARFDLPPTDPLVARARPITGDPASILGTMGGTYSACTPQQVSPLARKQIEVCAESRAPEERRCSRVLTVSVTEKASCVPGTWFTNTFVGVYTNWGWQVGVRVYAYCQVSGSVGLHVHNESSVGGTGSAVIWVDAATGATAPRLLSGYWVQDYASDLWFNNVVYHGGGCTAETCSFLFEVYGEACQSECSIPTGVGGCGTWAPPTCQRGGAQATGWFTFPRPRLTYAVSDRWDNQCAALEARLP